MPANDLSPLIHSHALVYSLLGANAVLVLILAAYVHLKFRSAARTLKVLQAEWQSAESEHANIAGLAQEKLSRLSSVTKPAATPARAGGIGFDTRNQVLAMARRGTKARDIARSCGLQEGEVDVVLGMARLQV